MPVIIPKNIPAFNILKEKNIFVMDNEKASHQDLRPLKIGILNLMPEKEETETQIFRMIGSSPLQIEPILIKTTSYKPKNVSQQHLEQFYTTFEAVKKTGLDGLIITGAPVEQMPFKDVGYWKELETIMDWSYKNVTSTLFLCWGAQAGLHHFYNIEKHPVKEKVFGVFKHFHKHNCDFLLRGLDDEFYVPHSYHTFIKKEDIEKINDLEILSETEEGKLHLVTNQDRRLVFMFGHPEYDRERLAYEYLRDKKKGIKIHIPNNCFPDNDPTKTPRLLWRANGETFYRNWINFVYQTTHYDIQKCRMDEST